MGIAEELEAAAARVSEQALGAVVGVGGRWPSGSGFVLAQGSVATSAHNVHGPGAQVHFGDGSRRDSTAVNADLAGDLAVVQVDTTGFTPVLFAAAAPQLGTPLFAAANPGGQGPRLSFGIVAGREREFRGPGGHPITGGFEHTAPLPHGSSGGPVLNLAGEVLGINTKRLGEGLYAALLTDAALRQRLELLGRGEPVVRPYLGVGLLPGEVGRRLRAAVGLPERNGVLVRHLDEEGPAARAGVLKGDLLTAAGGADLARAADLHRVLAAAKPGDQLQVALVRGAEEIELTVTLGTEPERGPRERHRPEHPRRR